MVERVLFAGADQPARRSFGISTAGAGEYRVGVVVRDAARNPFCSLVEFSRSDELPARDLLVVAPLSGHFPILLRDLVIGLIPHFHVYVTDWINARFVANENGALGLEGNISCILSFIDAMRPGASVVALCQGGIPGLAATALLCAEDSPSAPSSLVLIAAPIDPIANPSRVSRLLGTRPLASMEHDLIGTVPDRYPGRGRRVYLAEVQLAALLSYLARRVGEGGEMWAKILRDDGLDPEHFPFLDLYTSIMDLDAACFLENIGFTYHEGSFSRGQLRYCGDLVEPRAIRRTALLTIEGEWDDVAAPGQTSAAHALCSSVPASARGRVVVPRSGHFSLFHGETWRRVVLPELVAFCSAHGGVRNSRRM